LPKFSADHTYCEGESLWIIQIL